MVTTYKIPPCLLLQPFVNCYLLRETNGLDLIRPWFAVHEVYLTFFLKARPVHLINEQTGYYVKGTDTALQSLCTYFNGLMIFNGCYSILSICFKPNGFHKLFKFPLNEATNKIFDTEDIFTIPVKRLYEQWQNADNVDQIALFTDHFLLYFLKKQKLITLNDSITLISNSMLKQAGYISIEKFAYDANMSMRNFERRFSENLGISPKLYCRIIRFNHALELKLKNPSTNWSSIAQECGYFDQMHLIKDFKEFAGASPHVLLNQTPPPKENFIGVKRVT
jgi:AraC-like DNA-binding protein